MDVKETKLENSKISLRFEVPFEEFKDEFKLAFKSVGKEIALPGFRKGKTPENLLRQRAMPYVLATFKEEYSKKLISKYFEENKINVYGYPQIIKIEVEEGKPFIMDIEFEKYPEFELKPEDYSDISIEKINYEISDNEVDDEIKQIIKRRRLTEFADKDGIIEVNDTVYFNLTGKDAEGAEIQSLNIKDYPLNVRNKVVPKSDVKILILDEINNRVLGCKKGDKLEFKYDFNNTVESEVLAGKTADVSVEIVKVQIEKFPDITEETAKKMDYQSVEEMKNSIKNQLSIQKKQDKENNALNDFFGKIIEKVKIDAPLSMIDNMNLHQRDSMEKNFEMYNMKKDSFYDLLKTTPDEWLENNKNNAIRSIKEYLIKLKLVELEKIELSEEEINAELEKLAINYKTDKTSLKRDLIKSERWENFKNNLIEDKLDSHILVKFQK
ncbi:MAG TPA: trigger factor [bacterium]|nr:trigger factor [bacterium]HPN30963.1 trigger factor [bacterium]